MKKNMTFPYRFLFSLVPLDQETLIFSPSGQTCYQVHIEHVKWP